MNHRHAASLRQRSAVLSRTDAPRPAGLAMAIGSVLGIALPLSGMAAGPAGIVAIGDGTGIQGVQGRADHWRVTTTTVRSRGNQQVAFNAFSKFGVEQGQTVDLILPQHNGNQVYNLVNLVHDERPYINGTLNGFLADQQTVGGRVFFVSSHGMLVGDSGVLNVGALSIASANAGTMDAIYAGGDALDGLLGGTLDAAQLKGGGKVELRGRVNSQGGVRVQATAIDVSGTLLVESAQAGSDAGSQLLHLRPVVNAGQPNGQMELVAEGGKIQLRAANIADAGLGYREAEASVRVAGRLQADDIELSAQAVIDPGHDAQGGALDNLQADLTGSIVDLSTLTALGQSLAEMGVGELAGDQISALYARSKAKVEVTDTAQLQASGDIDLHASTRQVIDNSAVGKAYDKGEIVLDDQGNPVMDPVTGQPLAKKHSISLGAAYAQFDVTTEVVVAGGATVQAGGDLSLSAEADTTLALSAESFGLNNTATAFTAAISNVNVNTRAVLEGDGSSSAVQVGGDLSVSAVNQLDLETRATARTDRNGKVGLAGAISLQDIQAMAAVDRDVAAGGDVTVQAASLTAKNLAQTLIGGPSREPLPGEEEVTQIAGEGGDGLMAVAQSLLGSGIGKALEALTDDGSGDAPPPSAPPSAPARFRLGGAITVVVGDHGAQARVGDGVSINAGGDLVLDSQVVDAQIGNHAISNVQGQGKDNDGNAFALSAAVAHADLEHSAQTLVGSDARLEAGRIGLSSDVRLPRDFSALGDAVPDFSSFDAFTASLSAIKDAGSALLFDPSDLFTTYAAARGSAEQMSIGGSISYFSAANRATTNVAGGARLTSRSSDTAPWTVGLAGRDPLSGGDDQPRRRRFDDSLALNASVDVTALHSVGDLALANLKSTSAGQGGAAVGGSVSYADYDNAAIATVQDGASLQAGQGSIGIDAGTGQDIVSLALQSGHGGSIGVNGTASALDLNSTTIAGVGNRAWLSASRIGLDAAEDLFVWSVAGAVTMSDSLSVGASVAYQQMVSDTRAFIGRLDPQVPADPALAAGSVSTDALSLSASTDGMAGAVAAAGAVAMSKDARLKEFEDRLNAQNPGFLDRMKTRASTNVAGLENRAKALGMEGDDALAQYFGKAQDVLGGGAPQNGGSIPQPSFGVAVSGSATVNRSRQKTRAWLEDIQIHALGDTVDIDVAALNKTLLVSLSGALAASIANSNNNAGSAAIAGGVAYGDIRNTTQALLKDVDAAAAGRIVVDARNAGEQVNVGLGVGINASGNQDTAGAAAASVTLGLSANTTEAGIINSDLHAAGVAVNAINAARIANGGGALYVGGKGGVGVAVTYADIGDTTRASVEGGHLEADGDVRVRAASAARIVSAAAGGGYSSAQGNVGLAGSVVVNRVHNSTEAVIGGGAEVDFGGVLELQAGTASTAELAAVGDNCASAAGVDYCDAGGALDSQALVNADGGQNAVDEAGRNNGASSIVAVAGMAQLGGNNAGIAFTYNSIANRHAVQLADARVRGGAGSSVELAANDRADILGVGLGIGAGTEQFAGVGSISVNRIANQTAAQLGSAGSDTVVEAGRIAASAGDEAYIASLAGGAAYSGRLGLGAALTVNEVANTTRSQVDAATIDGDSLAVEAANRAKVMTAAVSVGFAHDIGLQGSAAWSTIDNTTLARVAGGSASVDTLAVAADNDSRLYTLAGAVAGSATAAAGAAVSVAQIDDTNRASIEGAALAVDGDLSIDAANRSRIKGLAIGGAGAGTAAVSGSNTTNRIDASTEAVLEDVAAQGNGLAGQVRVDAASAGTIHAIAGAVAGAGQAAVGLATTLNEVNGGTRALVENSDLSAVDGLDIGAASSTLVRSLAIGGAGAGTAAVSGSSATNLIDTDVQASLLSGQVGRAGGNVALRVSANDGRLIDSLAGTGAGAGVAGVGAAVSVNQIDGTVTASVGGGSDRLELAGIGTLEITAGDASAITSLAVGGAGAGVAGAAGSSTANRVRTRTLASLAGNVAGEEARVRIAAADTRRIQSPAGSGAGGAAAGVGLAVGINEIEGGTAAVLAGQGHALGGLASLEVAAASRASIQAIAIGAGGAGLAGVGGSTTTNLIDSDTLATVDGVQLSGRDLQVAVSAQDLRDIQSLAGAAGGAVGTGVGAAVGVNQISGDVLARVGQSRIDDLRALAVSAHSSSTVLSAAIAAAGGGAEGLGGSSTANTLRGNTSAQLVDTDVRGNNADVGVSAGDSRRIDSLAGSAAGGGAAGVGAAVSVNDIGGSVAAAITGNGHRLQGVSSLAVDAGSEAVIRSLAVGAAGGGAAAVGGSSTTNLIATAISAGLSVGAVEGGSNGLAVTVGAGDARSIQSLAGGAAGAGNAGVGAAVSVNDIGGHTAAGIDGTRLAALSSLQLSARSHSAITSAALAGAAGGVAGVGGSSTTNLVHSQTQATINDAQLAGAAAAIAVQASDERRIDSLAGAAAGGGAAGVGAAVSVNRIEGLTAALVHGSGQQASGIAGLDVAARSASQIRSLAIGAAGSSVAGVQGSSTANSVEADTLARFSGYGLDGIAAAGVPAGAVAVQAHDARRIASLAGAAAGGGVAGVGAAVSVNTIGGRTSAELQDLVLGGIATLSADAGSTSRIDSAAEAAGAGIIAGVAGSNASNLIDSDAGALLDNVVLGGDAADVTIRAADQRAIRAMAGGVGAGAGGLGAAVAFNDIAGSTTATVTGSATDLDVRNLLVQADATGNGGNRIETLAAGAAGVGVGGAASVAVNRLQTAVRARIDGGADVVARDNVAVLAAQKQVIDVLAGSVGAGILAGAGVGTVVNIVDGVTEAGIDGAATRVTALALGPALAGINNGVLANGNARSNQAGMGVNGLDLANHELATGSVTVAGLAVNAATAQSIRSAGVSAAASVAPLAGALGVMAGANQVGGRTLAHITGAAINQHGRTASTGTDVDAGLASVNQQVDVRASHHAALSSHLAGVSGSGGLAASGALSTSVFDGQVQASVDGATVHARDTINVQANGSTHLVAMATGLAGGLAGGAASGIVNLVDTSVRARVAGTEVSGNSLSIIADSDNAATLVGGNAAVAGGTAVAGTALVNVNQAVTEARLGGAGNPTGVQLGGGLEVSARQRADIGSQVLSGAGAGGVGVAGMAQLHLVQSHTRAIIDHATANAGDISVTAADVLRLDGQAGALAASGALGVGAGASVAVLGSTVEAGVRDSDVLARGALDVSALSERVVNLATASAGAGMTAGIGGAAGLVIAGAGSVGTDAHAELGGTFASLAALARGDAIDAAVLDGTLGQGAAAGLNARNKVELGALEGRQDRVSASVSGQALQAAALSVDATSLLSTSNRVGSLGAGVLGAGGAFGLTTLRGLTEAVVAVDELKSGTVSINARAGEAAGTTAAVDASAGAAGLASLGAAVAVADVAMTVRASASGTLGSAQGGLALTATDGSSVVVNADGRQAGAATAGLVLASAQRDNRILAGLAAGTTVQGFDGARLLATQTGAVHASADAASAGLVLGAEAAVAQATDRTRVGALVEDGSVLLLADDGLSVAALASPDVAASARGAALGGALAVGASRASAEAAATVEAALGNGVLVLSPGAVAVSADVRDGDVAALARAGAGSLYAGINAAVASARADHRISATLGDDVVLAGGLLDNAGAISTLRGGGLSVRTGLSGSQQAEASGQSLAGMLAIGAVVAEATGTSTLDTGVGQRSQLHMAGVDLAAEGQETVLAKATSGAGGLIAGNAAVARTGSDNHTRLAIGQGTGIDARQLRLHASHALGYAGQADSSGAGMLGKSGAAVENSHQADVLASLGEGVQLVSGGALSVRTDNNVDSLLAGTLAASAAGGGVLSGSASSVTTRLDGSSAIEVGRGALLASGKGNDGGNGELELVASTRASSDDQAGLTTGGVIDVARVSARTDARLANRVDLADNVRLNSNRQLNVGTYAHVALGSKALVNTWGVLAAVGKADARVDLAVDQQVNVGRGSLLESMGNAYLGAGEDGLYGRRSQVAGNAVAQGYSKGLVAVPGATATSNVDSRASARLAEGSRLLGGAFVSLGAFGDQVTRNAEGTATGYEVGFIPVTVRNSQRGGSNDSELVIDGQVVAGRFNTLDIRIDANGNLSANGNGGDVLGFDSRRVDSQALKAELNALGNHLFDRAAGEAASTWVIGDLYAAGGDVYLNAGRIRGTGSVTANGTPTITVRNESADNLFMAGDVLVPEHAGGNIFFTGGASGADGVAIRPASAGGRAAISISNRGSGRGAIIATGDMMVGAGDLDIFNALGSIYSSGLRSGNTVRIEAPNGNIEQVSSGDIAGNDPRALWSALSLARGISQANDAAGYIANALYRANAEAAGKSLTDYLLYRGSDAGNENGSGSLLVYGACAYRVGDQNCNSSALLSTFADGWVQSKYSHKDQHLQPKVNERDLQAVYAVQPESVSNARRESAIIAGGSVKVKAGGYIDLNVPVYAGQSVDLSLRVPDSQALADWVASQPVSTALVEVPAWLLAANTPGSQQIALRYDTVNRQFVVDNLQANGGGSIYLDGKIVSTSTMGSLNVQSGKGSVVIDTGGNDIDLRLGNITVGNGAPGTITLRDRAKGTATWYVRDANGNLSGWTGQVDLPDWSSPGAIRLSDTSQYNPLAGMKARWTETAYIGRHIEQASNGFLTAGQWYWHDGTGERLENGQQWNVGGVSYYVGSPGGPAFVSELTGGFSRTGIIRVGYACQDGNSGGCRFNYNYPGRNAELDGSGKYRSYWDYEVPDRGWIAVTNTVKADNPLAINFITNDSGLLSVTAGGNLLLDGRLYNAEGSTELTSVQGDIRQLSPQAGIVSNALSLDAAGSIGQVGADGSIDPLAVQMVAYRDNQQQLVPAGGIIARAGGNIALDVASDAAVRLTAGSAAGGYGDIHLSANGDITGIAGDAVALTGRNISLTSRYGSIGSINAPLVISANERWRSDGVLDGGLVTATAYRDVALRDVAGDFWVQRIQARYGDVRVEAPVGSILGAGLRGDSSFLSEAEVAELRRNLKLHGGGAEQALASYQASVDAAYRQYFQFLGLGQVVGGQYIANADAIRLYRASAEAANGGLALDDAAVAAWLAGQFDGLRTVFADAYGQDWASEALFTAGFDEGYRYLLAQTAGDSAAVAARKQQLYQLMTADSAWTSGQLAHVVNANALEAGGGSARGGEAVITGRNVTLVSGADVGRLDKTYVLSLDELRNGNLTDEQALALRLATTPGDVELLDALGNVLSADQVRNGAVVASLRIRSTSPLVLHNTGRTDVQADGDVYLHALDDLAVGEVRAGGNARLSSDGDLVAADAGSGPAVSVGGDLSLSAVGAIAGHAGAPLVVQVNGALLLASSGSDIRLRQARGDLRVGIVNGNGTVSVEVPDGSLLSYLKNVAAITGRQLQLVASGDLRDADGSALALRMLAGGSLDGAAGGMVNLAAAGDLVVGTLDAGGSLRLAVADGRLEAGRLGSGGGLVASSRDGTRVATLQADGDAVADATLGDVHVDALQVAGAARLNAGGDIELGDARVGGLLALLALDSVVLADGGQLSVGGDASIDAGRVRMGPGSRLAAGGNVRVDAAGDVQLGHVGSSAAQGRIVVHAGGSIAGNADRAVHLQGSDVQLLAAADIGSSAHALGVQAANLQQVVSHAGDISLRLAGNAVLGTASAAAGRVRLDADGTLSVGHLLAGREAVVEAAALQLARAEVDGDLAIGSAGDLALATAVAGGQARFDASGNMQLGNLASGGGLDANAGGDLALATAVAGGQARFDAGGNVQLGDLASGGDLDASAGGDLGLGVARVAGDARLQARGDLQVDRADVAGSMLAVAGRDLHVGQATVGTDAVWQSGRDLHAGDVRVGCRFDGSAAGQLSVDSLQAGCGIALATGTDLVLSTLQTAGDLALTSRGGGIAADVLAAGGSLQLDAATTVAVGAGSAGAGLGASSGAGQAWNSIVSGAATRLQAGGSVAVQTLVAGSDAVLQAAGDIDLASLQAASAALQAHGRVDLGQGLLSDRLVLEGDVVAARVVQQAHAQGPLSTVITGLDGGRARQVHVEVDARDAWVLERLSAVEAGLKGSAQSFALHDGDVSARMQVQLPQMRVLMDNTTPALQDADAQLFEIDQRFSLKIHGRALETSAYVLHFGNGVGVTSPNYNPGHVDDGLLYAGDSAVRYSLRTMGMNPWWAWPAVPKIGGAGEQWIQVQSAGVNAGAVN